MSLQIFTGMKIFSPQDRGQIGFKLGAKHFIYQKLPNLCRKWISLLTGLKVSFLAFKSVFFFRPGRNPWKSILNMLKIKNEVIPRDRNQRLDGKNGVICLLIMFTPKFKVMKM